MISTSDLIPHSFYQKDKKTFYGNVFIEQNMYLLSDVRNTNLWLEMPGGFDTNNEFKINVGWCLLL